MAEANWHDWPIRVYYDDTDAAGIVYHSNYLIFAERARTEMLRADGLYQTQLRAERNLVFVVKSCAVEFDQPARLDDQITVRTCMTNIGGASLDLAQNIWRDRDEVRLARLSVRIVHLKASTGRPERIESDLRALFLKRLNPAAAHMALHRRETKTA